MALYLPIRALNRSAAVRINGQKISTTATSYVDISIGTVRKELAYHSSIGQVFVVGAVSTTNLDQIVAWGANVDTGASASDMVVRTYAGELKTRSTGTYVVVAQTDTTLSASDPTNPRIDLIVADGTTGAVTAVAGTPAASPAVPATPAGKVALAQVAVAATTTAITNSNITDVRPR